MSRKKYDTSYEDNIEITPTINEGQIQPMFGGLIPQFQDNYQELDLDVVQKDLQTKAQGVISNVIKVFYKMDDDNYSQEIKNYLDQATAIESMNLQNLLLQVKASEHILWSLLGRLNATGSVDNSLYKLITETQEKSIALTMQVSNYVRSLPSYFKQLRFELETNIEMVHVEQTQEMIEQKVDDADSDNFVKRPQKGMRSMLKHIEEMEKQMETDGETIDDNINIHDKNIYTNVSDDESIEFDETDDLKNELIEDNEN